MDSHEFRHFLGKARDAAINGQEAWSVQSTGERLAVALALNQFEWLQMMDYTIAEALERIGPQWAALIPEVAKAVHEEIKR